MADIKEPSFLTSKQTATRLGVDHTWVTYLCRNGRLPGAFKANAQARTSPWLIPESAIDVYEGEKKDVKDS